MAIINTSDSALLDDIEAAKDRGETVTLVDIWADYCGPCKMYTPVLTQWAEDTGNTLLKLDADKNSETMIEHGILSIPTILVYKNGRLLTKLTGARPYAKLVRDLSAEGC